MTRLAKNPILIHTTSDCQALGGRLQKATHSSAPQDGPAWEAHALWGRSISDLLACTGNIFLISARICSQSTKLLRRSPWSSRPLALPEPGRALLPLRVQRFCPWRENPTGGPPREIDRVLVDEHLTSCSACVTGKRMPPLKDDPLCPRCFFGLFIKPRKPCLLRLIPCKGSGQPSAPPSSALADSPALARWRDLQYLKKVAGEESVDVEVRDPQGSHTFGMGQYQQMPFKEIIKRLTEGDASLYVTTQRIASDRYGPKALCGPPLCGALSCDFPVNPTIAGNLVPSQFNIWMGHSRHGSSSGLHHDFHDNFYCLLRGRKEFRLYSPGLSELLPTHGMAKPSNMPKLHPNGLISYLKGIRQDGAHELAVLRTRQLTLEQKASDLRALLNQREGAMSAAPAHCKSFRELDKEVKELNHMLSQVEAELDDCLEAALDAVADDTDVEDDESVSEDSELMEGRLVGKGAFPDHFCLRGTRKAAATSWEGPSSATNARERFWSVWVEEGDILYLPASWFHEVFSYSKSNNGKTGDADYAGVCEANVHLALNIWLHPPASDGTFEEPYPDRFWAQHAAPQIEKQKAVSAIAGAFTKQTPTSDSQQQGSTVNSNNPFAGSGVEDIRWGQSVHIPCASSKALKVSSPPPRGCKNPKAGYSASASPVRNPEKRRKPRRTPLSTLCAVTFKELAYFDAGSSDRSICAHDAAISKPSSTPENLTIYLHLSCG
ncbi:jmjC domain-containing protein 4 [Cyclospora cayetanensis]|uniref:JmjC domain-containing protein 4 n=1 Tax=Cyclospora cayetanensis TaxID=88456 RepID=A0A6P6S523_9EIME|nr:jmjC domain-containing protein 4 [Cyclospora cayetanensis]